MRGGKLTYYFLANRWAVETVQEGRGRSIMMPMPMGSVWLEGKRMVIHPQVKVVDREQPTAEGQIQKAYRWSCGQNCGQKEKR